MSETNNQYVKSVSLNGNEITFNMEDDSKLTMPAIDIASTALNFLGTCKEKQLFESGEDEFPAKGKKNGDTIYASDTDHLYVWVDNDWIRIDSDYQSHRKKKIIPFPTNCKNCGAIMHDYVCEACGTEHPSFEYIIEEE